MKALVLALALLAALSACASLPEDEDATAAPQSQVGLHAYVFGPGNGLTMATAVVINATSEATGVPAERMWINEHYPGARLKSQSLLNQNGRKYDAIEVTKGDGKVLTLYFDITSYFGKF